MTEITREEIEKWRCAHAEMRAAGHADDEAPADFKRLVDAAEAHLDEQSRIDAAVARERERCEREARRYAGFYPPQSDGQNTFVMLADFIAAGQSCCPDPTAAEPTP